MRYIRQLSKEEQIKIVIELVKLGLSNNEIDDALDSKLEDLADTINIKKLLKK